MLRKETLCRKGAAKSPTIFHTQPPFMRTEGIRFIKSGDPRILPAGETKAIEGLRPPFSAHVRPTARRGRRCERGAPVQFLRPLLRHRLRRDGCTSDLSRCMSLLRLIRRRPRPRAGHDFASDQVVRGGPYRGSRSIPMPEESRRRIASRGGRYRG
jgi:hypothetical protein